MTWHNSQSIATSLIQLVRTWWQQDRIRVSRNCGQLLSLCIGDRLLIDTDVFIITSCWKEFPNEESYHAIGSHGNPVLANDTVAMLGADKRTVTLVDDISEEAVPTHVVYDLRTITDQPEEAMHNVADEALGFNGKEVLCQKARLTVPLDAGDSILFYGNRQKREVLAEEIVILPRDGSAFREARVE